MLDEPLFIYEAGVNLYLKCGTLNAVEFEFALEKFGQNSSLSRQALEITLSKVRRSFFMHQTNVSD